jgi:hypothetical protein
MPRRVSKPDRLLALDENFAVVAVPQHKPRKRKPLCAAKRTRRFPATIEIRREPPPGDSVMRFRRLLLAALRVWELKNGIHDDYDSILD